MSYWNNGKFCNKISEIPTQPHWAILYDQGIHIPGDQRSRDCPGHGYGEHTENKTVYVAFMDRADWERQVGDMTKKNEKFTAIAAKPVKVEQAFTVTVIE